MEHLLSRESVQSDKSQYIFTSANPLRDRHVKIEMLFSGGVDWIDCWNSTINLRALAERPKHRLAILRPKSKYSEQL